MSEIERRETQGLEVGATTEAERRLASERVIINAPMSFAGAAQRAWRIGADMTGPGRIAMIALVIIPIILVWWFTVLGWYLIFGILLVPYSFYGEERVSGRLRC